MYSCLRPWSKAVSALSSASSASGQRLRRLVHLGQRDVDVAVFRAAFQQRFDLLHPASAWPISASWAAYTISGSIVGQLLYRFLGGVGGLLPLLGRGRCQ